MHTWRAENTFVTGTGEQRRIVLDDGSTLDLNTRSSVHVHFTDTTRRIELTEGEAYFSVAKDPARPFVVTAGNAVVRAVVKTGRGIDGFAVDERRHRIVTSNGGDGTLSVIGQSGADVYTLLGTIGTRPGARMMHMDQRTGRLFVVNADYTVTPAKEGGEEKNHYHPNSFVVLTYAPL